MSILKGSARAWRKNFPFLIFLEVCFLLTNFLFLVFVKNKLRGYLLTLEQYAPLIGQVQKSVQESAAGIFDAAEVLGKLQSATTGMIVFAYVIVPFVLILLWSLFQGWIWLILKSEEIKRKLEFLWQCFIVTAVIMGLFFIIAYQLINADALPFLDLNFLIVLLIAAVGYYFLTTFYASSTGGSFGIELKIWLIISIRKSLKIMVPMVLLFGASLGLFFLFVVLLLQRIGGGTLLLPLSSVVGWGAILVVANAALRLWLHSKTTRCE